MIICVPSRSHEAPSESQRSARARPPGALRIRSELRLYRGGCLENTACPRGLSARTVQEDRLRTSRFGVILGSKGTGACVRAAMDMPAKRYEKDRPSGPGRAGWMAGLLEKGDWT